MTHGKRRQWARVFIGARNHGLRRSDLVFFSIACAWRTGHLAPFVVALQVLARSASGGGRRPHEGWLIPATWRPIALGALAVGIALGGLLAPHLGPHRPDCPPAPLSEDVTTDWLSRAGGAIAVPIPPKRLERQQAPPCVPPPGEQEEINGGCWSEMRMKPPCGQFYEHAGKCYVPIRETPRPPTSVQP